MKMIEDDGGDDNAYSMLGCREKRALRANSSSSWSTTRSILNMMNKDDYQFIKTMITTRSILNMMNIKAEYVHEWFRGDGVHGGDGPDDDIGVVHHDRSDDADDHYDHGGDGDLPVKQTWAQGGSWGSRPW